MALFLGLAAYGVWQRLIFVGWLGFAFAASEVPRDDRRRALIASVAFFVGGLIIIVETVAYGPIDVGAALALAAGVFLTWMGAWFGVRIYRRRG